MALQYLEAGNQPEIVNLGLGGGVSVKDMIAAVERLCGLKVPVIMADDRPGDPAVLVADPSRAKAILGWNPRYSDIDSIIRSAYFFICQYQCNPKEFQSRL